MLLISKIDERLLQFGAITNMHFLILFNLILQHKTCYIANLILKEEERRENEGEDIIRIKTMGENSNIIIKYMG